MRNLQLLNLSSNKNNINKNVSSGVCGKSRVISSLSISNLVTTIMVISSFGFGRVIILIMNKFEYAKSITSSLFVTPSIKLKQNNTFGHLVFLSKCLATTIVHTILFPLI